MKTAKSAISVLASVLILAGAQMTFAQRSSEARRAQSAKDEEEEILRAEPLEEPIRRALPPARSVVPSGAQESGRRASQDGSETSSDNQEPTETEAPDQRQLNYANALFGRKLYDLAIPEYEKFLGQFPGASGRASAYFYL